MNDGYYGNIGGQQGSDIMLHLQTLKLVGSMHNKTRLVFAVFICNYRSYKSQGIFSFAITSFMSL